MQIRLAHEVDAEAISRLAHYADDVHFQRSPQDFTDPNQRPLDPAYWQGLTRKEGHAIFIAEDQSKMLGFVYCHFAKSNNAAHLVQKLKCFVNLLVVAQKYQRQGVGMALMDQVEAYARDRQADDIILEVLTFNQTALSFYSEVGYESFSSRLIKRLRNS